MDMLGMTNHDPTLVAIVQLFFVGIDLIVMLAFSIAFMRLRDRFAIFVLGAVFYDIIRLALVLIMVVQQKPLPLALLDAMGFCRGLCILGAVQTIGELNWNRRAVILASTSFVVLVITPLLFGFDMTSAFLGAVMSALVHLSICVLLVRIRLLAAPGTLALFMAALLSSVFYGGVIYAQLTAHSFSMALYYSLHHIMNVFMWVSLGVVGLDRVGIWLSKARMLVTESEQRFLLVANASTDAILAVNRQGRIVDWNSYASECFGWSRKHALEMNVEELIPDQTAATLAKCLDQSPVRTSKSGTQTFARFETTAKRKSGIDFAVEVTLVNLPKSGAHSLALIVRDITERKEYESQLIQAKEELENLNHRLESALEKATDMAAAANEANLAKSQFLATMSHEIRTPMNGIIGMTSLLSYTDINADQKDYVATIHESCDVLLTIINEILDFSKIEAGQLQLEFQSIDIRSCIESTMDLLGRNAVEKSLYFGYSFEEVTVSKIYSDETRLRQILVNLLGNALKFTESGGVFLQVSQSLLEDDQVETQFTVIDSGIGIPEENRDGLFKPFSQLDSSTSRRYGGTGLGLAICARLCHLLEGKIWVESEEKVGSRFHFTIRSKGLKSERPALFEQPHAELRGRSVVIMEGNQRSREILAGYCKRWQMEGIECPDPKALESVAEGRCKMDLLLLDYDLMKRAAFDFLALRNQILSLQALPYIVVSGPLVSNDIEMDRHCIGILSRPVKPSRLFSILQSFLEVDLAKMGSKSDSWRFNGEMASRRPLRILLAEDNLVNQKVALGFLKEMGYVADLAVNGWEVLDAVGCRRYDVVLMDVQMPELGGVEATQRMVSLYPPEKRPWIVAMTAGATGEDRERCLGVGMDDFLPKPICAEAFQDVIRRAPRLGHRAEA